VRPHERLLRARGESPLIIGAEGRNCERWPEMGIVDYGDVAGYRQQLPLLPARLKEEKTNLERWTWLLRDAEGRC
jgi:hypothetical protein